MSGRFLATLLFLLLAAAKAKLVVLDEADLLLSRFAKLVAIFLPLNNLVSQFVKESLINMIFASLVPAPSGALDVTSKRGENN